MRINDWQLRLEKFVTERRAMPFAWGSNDCALFAADAVFAMTGVDYAKDFRTYGSVVGAAEAINRFGGLSAMVSTVLGPELPPLMAGPGDVVLLSLDGRDTLGICTGAGAAIGPGKDGMVAVSMAQALTAWRVG